MSRSIEHLLQGWEYEPFSVNVRLIDAEDGREVIQMRVDMGILQLETTGRPDGEHPEGFDTYYEFLRHEAEQADDDFTLSEEQCAEADREFVQFYHRRVCWLSLRRFADAVRDADQTQKFMDFCKQYSPDEQWTLSHEQYRPFVLFHRTQAAALAELEEGSAEDAISAINEGLQQLRLVFEEFDVEEHFEDDDLVERLVDLRESLREEFEVGQTVEERLADAIAKEKYELAASLRDQLAKRNVGEQR